LPEVFWRAIYVPADSASYSYCLENYPLNRPPLVPNEFLRDIKNLPHGLSCRKSGGIGHRSHFSLQGST